MVINHRSIFPKFNHLIDELTECNIQVGIHSEIWEDNENVDHKNKIEEALEIHGVIYISNPRPKRRGGGAAITLSDQNNLFTLSKLPIHVPPDLEVCWGLVKPRFPGSIKDIIICSFYCPPRSKKKTKLVEHISTNYYSLKSVYPGCAFIAGGDKNDLNVKHLLDISPSFRQIVTKATHKHSILDVIITDVGHLYNEPDIRPPLLPDDPNRGVPSDHMIVLASPAVNHIPPKRTSITRNSRPLNTLAKRNLSNWIQNETWDDILEPENPTVMVNKFTNLVKEKIDVNVPLKTFKLTCLDNEFTTPAIKHIKRKKNREYVKHGNTLLYKQLKKDLKNTIKIEGKKFVSKQIELAGENSNRWIRRTSALLSRPGVSSKNLFDLPDHLERDLSELESAEEIADFFSKISQEYEPLSVESLPDRVRLKLDNDPCDDHPTFEEHDIFRELNGTKMTCSVPDDIPADILNEFLPEFCTPITAIFNCCFSSHTWPDSYKKEFGVPINKVPVPESVDDLRSIGLTPYLSKRLEKLLIKWIWKYISPHICSDQLGGLPGCSIVHYIIRMMDFILRRLDNSSKNPGAVIATTVDFSKAFNRMSHNIIVTILSDLNIPTCALKLIISYLSNRSLCIRYHGAVSGDRAMPGGGPQGTLLIVLLFILQVNLAGAPCAPPPTLPAGVAGPEPNPVTITQPEACHDTLSTENKKFVDDLTMLEHVNLSKLVPKDPFIGPLNFHERHGLYLPANETILQHKLKDLLDFTRTNQMKINMKKTKILPFNFSKTKDFVPELSFPGGENLEVIYQTKLVGVIVDASLCWNAHIAYTVKNANKKLWLLVRFKNLGATHNQLLTLFHLKIRCLLEFAAPAFHGSLTKQQSDELEMIQKKCFAIILGSAYKSYNSALKTLSQEKLCDRRLKLCLNFAIKCTKHPRHSDLFLKNPRFIPSSKRKQKFIEPKCLTTRYYNSAVPYLTRLLNSSVFS